MINRLSGNIMLLFFCLGIHSNVLAKDLGVYGQTWTVVETDPVQFIQSRLKGMEKTGELVQHVENIKKKTIERIKRPKGKQFTTRQGQMQTYSFDPSFIVPRDITDQNGNFLARAGEKINPMSRLPISYKTTLVFIDGDDRQQVKWFKSNFNERENLKLILVSGSPIDLESVLKIPVYFDQAQKITTKFNIETVPTVVDISDGKILIKEVALHEE